LHNERRVERALHFKLELNFLLNPAERLYFAQDSAFSIRGLLDTEASDGN